MQTTNNFITLHIVVWLHNLTPANVCMRQQHTLRLQSFVSVIIYSSPWLAGYMLSNLNACMHVVVFGARHIPISQYTPLFSTAPTLSFISRACTNIYTSGWVGNGNVMVGRLLILLSCVCERSPLLESGAAFQGFERECVVICVSACVPLSSEKIIVITISALSRQPARPTRIDEMRRKKVVRWCGLFAFHFSLTLMAVKSLSTSLSRVVHVLHFP
jgi:hypothetical protein